MIDEPERHSRRSAEGRHPLDGIRLRLPLPPGQHHAEVVASFARWLGHRHGLEPFDLELSDAAGSSGGKLTLHALTPARELELSVRRSRDAMRRADTVGTSSTILQMRAALIRERAGALLQEGRQQQEATRALRTSAADLRSGWRDRFEASVTHALTKQR